MVQKAFLITAMIAIVLGGCGAKPPAQKEPKNEIADFAKELKPPPGVPSGAVLITGASGLRQMLMGKRLQPVSRETEFDQGDEYFRSDKFWEKRNLQEAARPYLGFRIDWQETDFCIYYLAARRCTSLWRNTDGKLFASHYYLNGQKTPVYEVTITEFGADKISERNKGSRK